MKKKYFLMFILTYVLNKDMIINGQDFYKIYYLENNFEESLSFDSYIILKELLEEEKIRLLLETYIYNSNKRNLYIPNNTKVLETKIINKDLFINFNENILNYGGSNYEINLIRLILHTCFQFENIETVTFLIEGKFKFLPEGSLVFKYTREDLALLDYNQIIHLKEKYD